MLRKALAALDEGDTLVVVRLDRLARSTSDLPFIKQVPTLPSAGGRSEHDLAAGGA
jgi:hypothetical protein